MKTTQFNSMALLIRMDEVKKPGPKPVLLMVTEPWHEAYIDFLADPADQRDNLSFCREHNVHERTFYRWKAKFREQIYTEANRKLKSRRSELRIKGWKKLEQLMDTDGSTALKALELYFKLNGDLVERVESKSEMIGPEEKKQKVAESLERLQAHLERKKRREAGEEETPTND